MFHRQECFSCPFDSIKTYVVKAKKTWTQCKEEFVQNYSPEIEQSYNVANVLVTRSVESGTSHN